MVSVAASTALDVALPPVPGSRSLIEYVSTTNTSYWAPESSPVMVPPEAWKRTRSPVTKVCGLVNVIVSALRFTLAGPNRAPRYTE